MKYFYLNRNDCSWPKGLLTKNISFYCTSIWLSHVEPYFMLVLDLRIYRYTKILWNNTATLICISAPLHVICYRVKSTQRNYCIFRGRSPRIFQLFCRNVKKPRKVRSRLNSGLLYTEQERRSNIVEWKNERDARDAVSSENRCIYL